MALFSGFPNCAGPDDGPGESGGRTVFRMTDRASLSGRPDPSRYTSAEFRNTLLGVPLRPVEFRNMFPIGFFSRPVFPSSVLQAHGGPNLPAEGEIDRKEYRSEDRRGPLPAYFGKTIFDFVLI